MRAIVFGLVFFLAACHDSRTIHLYSHPLTSGGGLESQDLSLLDGVYVVQDQYGNNTGLGTFETTPQETWLGKMVKSFLGDRLVWSIGLEKKHAPLSLHGFFTWIDPQGGKHLLLEAAIRPTIWSSASYALMEMVVTDHKLALFPLFFAPGALSERGLLKPKTWIDESANRRWYYSTLDTSSVQADVVPTLMNPGLRDRQKTYVPQTVAMLVPIPNEGKHPGIFRWSADRNLWRSKEVLCAALLRNEQIRDTPLRFEDPQLIEVSTGSDRQGDAG